MGTAEENKRIVQEALNKKAAARREALENEKQEKITASMFKVVNDHAKVKVDNAYTVRKKARQKKKRIVSAKKHGDVIVKSFWRSIMLLVTSGFAHAIGVIELWLLLLIFMTVFNAYKLWQNADELAKLT